jgi:hypothetical protein
VLGSRLQPQRLTTKAILDFRPLAGNPSHPQSEWWLTYYGD